MKNIRKRKDGRWEGRKTINNKRISVFAKTQKECLEKLKQLKAVPAKTLIPKKFYDFALYWLENYKKNQIVEKSYKSYKNLIEKYLSNFKNDISKMTLDELQKLMNELPATRTREYLHLTIRQIFKKALELELIKKDISLFLTKGKINRTSRKALTIAEQRLLLLNLSKDLFSIRVYCYLMLGCRPNEIQLLQAEKNAEYVFINGTKTKNAKRWVKVSTKINDMILKNIDELKKTNATSFNKQFREFAKKLNIKANLYMLRHTFATNLFYLGVPDKERQVYMGHSSSILTNDIYTTFDRNVKKEDILNLYKDLYPKFD